MRIGYYVHHQGAGHATRAAAIAEHLGERMTMLGTGLGDGPQRINLADDRCEDGFGGIDHVDRPEWLHYAPLHHRGVQQRHARIAAWIAEAKPALMVVDVSVEIACLARLCGVPVISVRLLGDRSDRPHLGAFTDAAALLAAFPAALDDPAVPAWIMAKTFHAGLIAPARPAAADFPQDVVVLLGRGGTDFTAADVAAAAAATPDWRWLVLGEMTICLSGPPNLTHIGWVDEPGIYLSPTTILVAGGGDGAVAAAAAAGCRFICVPQQRAYGEQHAMARALHRIGAAIVCDHWPLAENWAALLARAALLDAALLASLHAPQAAADAARFILAKAASEG